MAPLASSDGSGQTCGGRKAGWQTSTRGGTAMTIGKKLYMNFGAILAMVLVLFLINLVAVQREHSAKAAASQALSLADATDKVKFQIMQNRLYLSNYLLSGDTREVYRMNDGLRILSERLQSTRGLSNSEQQRVALDHVQQTEQNWAREFALPLVEKRKEVDAGNATVAELQIFYLQKATEYLDLADQENKKMLDDRRRSDDNAATATILVALTSTLIALALGVVIAYSTSKSITEPLRNLMKVAQQIGNAGDLDHVIDIKRSDEIGELARTFTKMVTYLK
jgi:HAMP domain-containing protein